MSSRNNNIKALVWLLSKGNVQSLPRRVDKRATQICLYCERTTPGAGAGKGGGAGGSIKEAGGSLGKYGAVQEESYFHKLTRELLKKIKEATGQSEKEDRKEDKK